MANEPEPKTHKASWTSANEAYTVGWVCALHTEYVAACEMLDDEHGMPDYNPSKDDNVYTLGQIGDHHVVIAVMPKGEYGTISAASTARDMVRSFPNIKFGLMVGVGGGVPSTKHDIRLGDIVVSNPEAGRGGVYQYDFGKEVQGQPFQNLSFLNQPPRLLRAAVATLMGKHERKGNGIDESVAIRLDKNKRLRKKYSRPSSNTDKLYKASYSHRTDGDMACNVECGDNPENLVKREPRDEDEDIVSVHYGLIASSNKVIKDARFRDRLAIQEGVLCFEMEAAGLMNHFPCLVIRGICDYADSHKNKAWQGYAAMTAATYAKDLLTQIAPTAVQLERKISEVIASDLKDVKSATQSLTNAVASLDVDQKQAKVIRWISPPDASVNYNEALKKRHQGTGNWLIQSEHFLRWKTQPKSFLWLYGIPGCGKTILSSTVIEHLRSSSSANPVIYFYFSFNDNQKQSLENMMRSIIVQLYSSNDATRDLVNSLYTTHENGLRQSTHESLSGLLLQILKQVGEIWIILDALDECHTREGPPIEGILSWLRQLLTSDQQNVHLLVTSRPEQDIQAAFSEWIRPESKVHIQHSLISDDISAYIHSRVREDDRFKRWRSRQDVQEQIETTLNKKADGMFRWVACQLDVLKDCLSLNSLEEALATLPKTLDETYHRILQSIPKGYMREAILILQFLAYSERPLRIEEVIDAISTYVNKSPHFDPIYRMPDPLEISRYCSSLVAVISTGEPHNDGEEGKGKDAQGQELWLQLSHFSVNEYLTSNRLEGNTGQYFQEVAARGSISTICLAFLLHVDRQLSSRQIRDTYPFAQYSASYWMTNAAVAEDSNETLQTFIKKFINHKDAYDVCYDLYRPDRPWEKEPREHREAPASPLYYTSLAGMVGTINWLLENNADVNAQGGLYGNALQAASYRGHQQVVERLLAAGADVNAQGGEHSNALYAASYRGHQQVVEQLLAAGADVNARGGFYSSALQVASEEGHQQIVEQLLAAGADVNAQGRKYGNALYVASYRGHQQVVEQLLAAGADVNAQGGEYGNALCAASDKGHKQVVEQLLAAGADVNAQGRGYSNALYAASEGGYRQIVERLLAAGADVNAQGGFYGNALQVALSEGGWKGQDHQKGLEYQQVVERLLAAGADVNGEYVLYAASGKGHKQVVEWLLAAGADVNAQNALYAASYGGHLQVVERLLAVGADIDAQDGEYGSALYAASEQGHQQVVERLLAAGADVNAQGGEYGNMLYVASYRGHQQVVEQLLAAGANVNARGGFYSNALQAASEEGHQQIVEQLLAAGADVNA